jgi:hypothetical protein
MVSPLEFKEGYLKLATKYERLADEADDNERL